MPKKRRLENVGLPPRWRYKHGAYRYQVPPGQEDKWDGKQTYSLGKTLPDAYREWARKLEHHTPSDKSIGQLLDKYACEVIPTKSVSSQKRDYRSISKLKLAFDKISIEGLQPCDIYKYAHERSRKFENEKGKLIGGISAAKHEIALLSHVFTKAVEWGFIRKHPFKNEVRIAGSQPRTRYIEDWEIRECLSLKCNRKKGSILSIQAYIRIKLLTGLSQSDLLRIQPSSHIKEDGIHIQRHKTAKRLGKRTIYEWTPELRAAIKQALAIRPIDIGPFLFCTKHGEGYIDEKTGEASGWNSMWQRFMRRVLNETKVTERFTEHDLRAKCASDAKSLEHARALLSHVDIRTTNVIYRRKPERVKPVR